MVIILEVIVFYSTCPLEILPPDIIGMKSES